MKFKKLPLVAAIISTGAMAGVPLESYTEATSAYEDAYINAQFDARSGNQEQSSYNVDLKAAYDKVFSSPDTNTRIKFDGFTSNARSGIKGAKSNSNYNALLQLTHDMYFDPSASKAFWYGSGAIGLQKDQEDPMTRATVGVGYGRVVNATPMAKANRLIEALLERGLLASQPSSAKYHDIARIINKEAEYRSKHGAADYKQYWMQDIHSALGVDMDARGIIKAYDVLENERISTRKYGWLVRAGVGAVITDYDGEGGTPILEAAAEYHNPISNLLQFSNTSSFVTLIGDEGKPVKGIGTNISASGLDQDVYRFTNNMSLTYELSDRVDWENSWVLFYENRDIDGAFKSKLKNINVDVPEGVVRNTLTSTFRYYLSNLLSLNITAQADKYDDDIKDNGNDDVVKTLNVGLSYRLK